MILIIARLLLWFFPKLDIRKAQQFAIAGLIVLAVFVLFFGVLSLRSCFKKEAKIDLETIEKINKGNEAERKQELTAVVEKNAAVISSADNRTAIAEANVYERDLLIAEKVKAIDARIIEAKSQGKDITGPELECLLIPENCK